MSILCRIYSHLKRDPRLEIFIKFSLKKLPTRNLQNQGISLVELGTNFTGTIALSYFTRVWLSGGQKLIGFRPYINDKILPRILDRLFSKFSLDNGLHYPFRLARAIGIDAFLFPKRFLRDRISVRKCFQTFISIEREALLHKEVNGIRVGDLFYDWHLRKRGLATVDTNSFNYRVDLMEFLNNFFFWNRILDNKKYFNIIVSHTVYLQGILVRLGLARGINVYLVSFDRVYRLSSELVHADIEFRLYDPDKSVQLGYKIDLERANKKLTLMGSEIDLAFGIPGLVSGLHGEIDKNLIEKTEKLKVLIAPHCFSDSPHAMGDFLFCDYFEWLNFICTLSMDLDYDWYIKPHPGFLESDKHHFQLLTEKFPNLKIIDKNVSNLGLFKDGIDVVVTAQGTIGFEAATFGVLALNASAHAPASRYNFTLSPSTVSELSSMLFDLEKIKDVFKIDRGEVLHFYDLHYLRRANSWLFKEKGSLFFNQFEKYSEIFESPKVFDVWMNQIYNALQDENRIKEVVKFLDTSDYQLETDMETP
jgi:hypothetical protein